MVTEIFQKVTEWYMTHMNYATVTLLMTVESSFIPFPSEIVVPPAAWKAAQGGLNVVLVAFCGTLGSIFGALFNYYFARFLGRKVIYSFANTRIAHFILIDAAAVKKAEDFFLKYGKLSTFVGRLIPGIRQLISLPAGLAKMDMKSFLLFTLIGSGIWNIILAALGFYLYSQKELLEKYYKELSYGFLGLGALFIVYVIISGIRKHRQIRA